MYCNKDGIVFVYSVYVCFICVNMIMLFEIVIVDKGFFILIIFVRFFFSVFESMM